MPTTLTIGVVAALSAALLWAAASFLFSRLGQDIPPLPLNLFKGVLGLLLLTLTLLPGGLGRLQPDRQAWMWLGVSGLLGISLGDTAYLAALNRLGARRTLLITTLAPPMTALFGFIAIGESLSTTAWVGILLTTAGVAWVISERTYDTTPPRQMRHGIALGLLAALAQSSAVILSRAAFLHSTVTALQSAIIRLAAGVAGLVLWMILTRQPLLPNRAFRQQPRLLGLAFAATFLGTYLAMWLQQVSLTHAPAGIVQTLLATSPLFSLPLAAASGERITLRATFGAFVAALGVGLLFAPTFPAMP